jgi:Zn-dependent protease
MTAQTLLAPTAALAIHEAGHCLAAVALGVRVKRIGFGWLGPYVVREAGTPRQNLAITLAGPLANLLTAWAVTGSLSLIPALLGREIALGCNPLIAGLLLYWRLVELHPLYVASLALGWFNLMPLPLSDGLRAYKLCSQLWLSRFAIAEGRKA